MIKQRLILKVVNVFVAVTFLWTNSVWAGFSRAFCRPLGQSSERAGGVSAYKLAAWSQLKDQLAGLRVVYTGTAQHAILIEEGIIDQETYIQNEEKIRGKLRESIGSEADGLNTLILQGEGGTTYYTFTERSYFYRVTSAREVNSPLDRLIRGFLPQPEGQVDFPVNGDTYYLEIIHVPTDQANVDPRVSRLLELITERLKRISDKDKVHVRPSSRFKVGYEPTVAIPGNIAVETSSLTAAVLTKLGLRGKALGLDKKKAEDKKKISEIKDVSDGIAKKIYEWIVKVARVILKVRVSEGFGRDEVAESFKANDVVAPDKITGDEPLIDAIIDVIEGTNAFVYDVGGKELDELEHWESGATSVIVTGQGVESLGNCPDIYVDGIFTLVPPEKRQEFVDSPLDPEVTASDPAKIEEYLARIADANGIEISDLEVVLMDRTREAERISVIEALQRKYPGLELVLIKDGTVAHSLLASFGRQEGKHKVVMTVGGAPEGFLNLAVASIFRSEGALASMRIYSKNVNKTLEGTDAYDLSRRYDFSSREKNEEKVGIRKLRSHDSEDIIRGRKLFTQEDVRGDVEGSFSFITHNGVFGVKGVERLPDGRYKVVILRVGKVNGKPCVWFEDKIFTSEQMDVVLGRIKVTLAAGTTAVKRIKLAGQAMIAVNVVSYNQIEGHLRAAHAENAGIILEVARSQLGYALDEKTTMRYVNEAARKLKYDLPIIVHGDHIQYAENLFKVRDKAQLAKNAKTEREVISAYIERLVKAGFTSIAIDASTLYDEVAGDAVLAYYKENGTDAEKLITELEEGFELPLEWGVGFLKMDPKDDANKARLDQMKAKVKGDMERWGQGDKVSEMLQYMDAAFGILYKKAEEKGLSADEVISAYNRIMREVSEATIAGKLSDRVRAGMAVGQRDLLLPTSNVAETIYQVKYIEQMVSKYAPELKGVFGIEVEVGHVDKKVPNPRRGGALEAKMTHPSAVAVMGERLTEAGCRFDLIATNNGSGHGTEFDKMTLTPVSQVGKITPWLTAELQVEADRFGATIAQHGTSGSRMEELGELSAVGVSKFNIATNYQQIILNVLSLLDDVGEDAILESAEKDIAALESGLHENTRRKIQEWAAKFKADPKTAELDSSDSLFVEFIKRTYAWGIKKGKIKDSSDKGDIGKVLAKEFKRMFCDMDGKLYGLKGTPVQQVITMLIEHRDRDYLKAVNSTGSADAISAPKDKAKGSHLVRRVEGGKEETPVYTFGVNENGVLEKEQEIPSLMEQEIDEYAKVLEGKEVLERLRHIFGPGIFTMVNEIQIVEDLNGGRLYPEGRAPLASYKDGVLKIDKLLFAYGKRIVFEELEHELLESIGDLIPGSNKILSDVVATLRNVRRFLDPNLGVTDEEYKVKTDREVYQDAIISQLRGEHNPIDPDGEYEKLLISLQIMHRKGEVTEEKIILSVISYVMKTKVYETVRDELGLPEELAEKLRDLDLLVDDVLTVFNVIMGASRGQELVEKVNETEDLSLKVIKTFTGTVRIRGLERLSKKLAGIVARSVKVAGKMNEVAEQPLAIKEGKYCIVLDRDRIPEEMRDKWKEEIARLEKNNVFKVVYTLSEAPEGYKIIHLIDPVDIREDMPRGILYLPMPYLRSSLYMAAAVVMAEGNVNELNQGVPLVMGLIGDLYSQMLGRSVTAQDLERLFTAPWLILPEIRSILSDMNKLHMMLIEIEKAA